jgi:hypothetical protein
MIFAVVPHNGGVVSNIVVGDALEVVEAICGDCVEVTEETGEAYIGYLWNGAVFSSPEPEGE